MIGWAEAEVDETSPSPTRIALREAEEASEAPAKKARMTIAWRESGEVSSSPTRSAWREAGEVSSSPTRSTWREAGEVSSSPTRSAWREAGEVSSSPTRSTWREAGEVSSSPTRNAWREAGEVSSSPTRREVEAAAAAAAWSLPESIDLWTEVTTKHLAAADLIRLSCACRWLHGLIEEDSIWRYVLFRDLDLVGSGYAYFRHLHVPTIKPIPHRYWYLLYMATFGNGPHALLHKESCYDEPGGRRVTGFVVDDQLFATARLPVPKLPPILQADTQGTIEMTGSCVLTNVCRGVWIADMRIVDCPGCSIAHCKGSKQILDARHCDVLLEEQHWDSLEHEDIGSYCVDRDVARAFCAIFNNSCMASASDADWIGDRQDLKTKTWSATYAAAINTNLQQNKGLSSFFEALRDPRKERKLVWLRVSQVV